MKRGRVPFTMRERRAAIADTGGFRRPVNNWGDGDLPAPWARGDVVRIRPDIETFDREFVERMRHGITGRTWCTRKGSATEYHDGYFVVCSAFSIDEGDAWYFRVIAEEPYSSDRLHVAYADRCEPGWERDVDFMEPFELVDTRDPAGLALRERMLADGWTLRSTTHPP